MRLAVWKQDVFFTYKRLFKDWNKSKRHLHWCYSPQLCECFSNNQLDEAEVQAQIVRHQQEIDQTNPVYSCDDASGEYVRRVLTEYIVQNLPGDY